MNRVCREKRKTRFINCHLFISFISLTHSLLTLRLPLVLLLLQANKHSEKQMKMLTPNSEMWQKMRRKKTRPYELQREENDLDFVRIRQNPILERNAKRK
jgi:predicted proteasome-type protease